jgi:hypothetical protein
MNDAIGKRRNKKVRAKKKKKVRKKYKMFLPAL